MDPSVLHDGLAVVAHVGHNTDFFVYPSSDVVPYIIITIPILLRYFLYQKIHPLSYYLQYIS